MVPLQKPPVTKELLDYLEILYPDRLPPHADFNEREMICAVGHRQVIRHLRHLFETQHEPQEG